MARVRDHNRGTYKRLLKSIVRNRIMLTLFIVWFADVASHPCAFTPLVLLAIVGDIRVIEMVIAAFENRRKHETEPEEPTPPSLEEHGEAEI